MINKRNVLVRTMQLSGGLYSYNRFDAYEESLKEGSGASTPEKMKKKVDKESKKARKGGRYLRDYDENEEEKEEAETAGGEAADGGGMSEAVYGGTPAEPKKDKKMLVTNVDKRGGTPAYANMKAGDKRYKAADHMKEGSELNSEETKEPVMENRMAMYSRALGVMGAHYSGPSIEEASKPDYLDFDKDGDEEEPMKKALKEKGKKAHDKAHEEDDKKEMKKEEVSITKESVVEYLVSEGYASNEVSAEILHQHISDEFLAKIEEQMIG